VETFRGAIAGNLDGNIPFVLEIWLGFAVQMVCARVNISCIVLFGKVATCCKQYDATHVDLFCKWLGAKVGMLNHWALNLGLAALKIQGYVQP
jgi:hypothetical protein